VLSRVKTFKTNDECSITQIEKFGNVTRHDITEILLKMALNTINLARKCQICYLVI